GVTPPGPARAGAGAGGAGPVRRGEIHGLLGENGAGKSTLMKVLSGLVRPDGGLILRDGEPIDVADPHVAARMGVGMVHQHFSLIGALTVWENVILGDDSPAGRRRGGRLSRDAACAEVVRVGERYGIPVDPLATVDSLSAGERQRVEIIKCLRKDPDVLVLDEPTSVLSMAESRELFAVLRGAVTGGDEAKAVVLISHKLAEILAATDRVTVLRRGRVVARLDTRGTDAATLAREMVGREVSLGEEAAALGLTPVAPAADPPEGHPGGAPAAGAAPVLELDGVTLRSPTGATPLDGFTLSVRPGEIVGLYGVEGNGQSALGDVLAGLAVPDAGAVRVAGQAVDPRRPGALHAAGVGVIPEDRHRSGVVLDMSVADNLVMTDLGPVSGRLFVNRRRQRAHAAQLAERFAISCPSLDAPLRTLSGGNQQRVVLARELSAQPAVLVAAQPTRGLDVGAIEGMYAELRAAAAAGVAVLLVSTELEEVMALSHRIAVISAGRMVGELAPTEADAERLGLLVGGGAAGPPAPSAPSAPPPSSAAAAGSAR
ncbi:ATP-binding cassette domain-containing protein, partial [Frankia sp. CNm7]|uniref:ABC transporter ATP-binding protein n=1 Tax=Frankia nepalensis TaxID=1836974 RepID=UPI001932035F